VLDSDKENVDTSYMREGPEMQPRKTAGTRFKVRLEASVGVAVFLVASMVISQFAAAAAPKGAMTASHSARVGSARVALVSLTTSNSRQGARAPSVKGATVVGNRAPAPLWPHWGDPLAVFGVKGATVVGNRAPAPLWPHWGDPLVVFGVKGATVVGNRAPAPLWPHWGDPLA
jgi:hypothetical protein